MSTEDNIKVVVRLRPFLQTIKDEANGQAKRIIHMDDLSSSVSIINPEDSTDIHKFTFDNILWSFDGYVEQADGYLAPENKSVSEEIYCDQKQVYDKDLVQNLWNGYNATVFTLGESKSGKSWTLFGLGSNKGILPQSLADLFKGIRDKEKSFQQNGIVAIEVRLSMAEVYNERIKDLLPAPSSVTKFKSCVKIREHSRKGFYIEGLRNVLVMNHEDFQQRLEEGLQNRAVYLTNICATLENSATIISVTLVQKLRNQRADEVTRMATLEFIDLPACEISKYKHSNIHELVEEEQDNDNSSNLRKNGMDSLSDCVDKLLEASIGKLMENPPFSSHSIPKLLHNALNANSKTTVIVALSPSEHSFQNSLYVLELAEKLRLLTTRSTVNEEITLKLVRELKAENEKLRKMVSLGEFELNNLSNHLDHLAFLSSSERDAIKKRIADDMKGQIRDNEKEIRNLQQPLEERLKPFKNEKNDVGKKIENDRKSKCHLFNLNGDSQISGRIIHIIPLGNVDFGSITNHSNGKARENNQFISFCGPGIEEHHGKITYSSKDGKFSIRPVGPTCKILVNEVPIQYETVLINNDRIILGCDQVWVYQNSKEAWLEKYTFPPKLHYEHVMEGIVVKSELFINITQSDSNSESLQKQLQVLIPALEEAKSISYDLNQNFAFQPLVIQSVDNVLSKINADNDNASGYPKVEYIETKDHSTMEFPFLLIKVQNCIDGTFNYWNMSKFFDRLESLKLSYMQFVEDGDAPLKEIDAFRESTESSMPVGCAAICLNPLAYLINIENSSVPILDFSNFQRVGSINVSINFLEDSGEKVNDSEVFMESPNELLDENLIVRISLQELQNVVYYYKDIYCKYKFINDKMEVTKHLDSRSSNFSGFLAKHDKEFHLGPITDNILNVFLTQFLILQFYGKQKSTKMLNLSDSLNSNVVQQSGNNYTEQLVNHCVLEKTMAQLKIKEKVQQRQFSKLNSIKDLVEKSEQLGEEAIPVTVIKTMFEAKTQKLVDQSLEDHIEELTVVPEDNLQQNNLPPELKAIKRFSEICTIV